MKEKDKGKKMKGQQGVFVGRVTPHGGNQAGSGDPAYRKDEGQRMNIQYGGCFIVGRVTPHGGKGRVKG